ncbi:MAG: hypothetical protein ACXW18_12295 [Pyrinomonadaceae bacterium]
MRHLSEGGTHASGVPFILSARARQYPVRESTPVSCPREHARGVRTDFSGQEIEWTKVSSRANCRSRSAFGLIV